VFRNEISVKTGIWNSTLEVITISVDGLGIGSYNYTIIVWDIGGNPQTDTVWVTVEDTTPPDIPGPIDIEYAEGLTGNDIVWNPSDLYPFSQIIERNGLVLRSTTWDGSPIAISADGLSPGEWNFTLIVSDSSGNIAVDTVMVTVNDVTLPTIDHPSNIEMTEGASRSIIWNPFDSNPDSYIIYRNGTSIDSGSWDGSSISVSLDGLAVGVWNYTLVVQDGMGYTIGDTVFVTVLVQTAPTTTTTTTTETTTTTTTTQVPPPIPPMVIAAASGGIGLVVLLAALFLLRKRKGPGAAPSTDIDVDAGRGGEFVGNRLRFKVKVMNNSSRVITDVNVTVTSYPRDSLKLDADSLKAYAKIDPKGFRSPTFEFLPTKDCVKGDIIATVSFVDPYGQAHSLTTKPYTVRAVCDLLNPESITQDTFILKLATLGHGETITKVDDWTPEEMHDKTVQILKDSNFFEVSSSTQPVGDHIEAKVQGWAKGIYTGKNLGVEITISGKPGIQGATCKVRVSGEDEAMVMPAIDEISQKLGAWLCPRCGGALPEDAVELLKDGKSTVCPFCNVTLDR
jgi:hypothetical protein